MLFFRNTAFALLSLSGSLVSAHAVETPLPEAIVAPGETVVEGSCETVGIYRSAPYSTDYLFLRED